MNTYCNLLKLVNLFDSFLSIFELFQIPYIETSAKDPPLNVDAAFHEVVRVIREQPIDLKDTRKKRRAGKLSRAQCTVL